MRIENTTTGINFILRTGFSKKVKHGDIISIELKNDFLRGTYTLKVILSADKPILVVYNKVTYPVTSNATQLRELLLAYNNNTGGYHVFTAINAQTVFDCSPYFTLNDNYLVFIGGALQIAGHSRVGNTVVFSPSIFTGGEEVAIMVLN